MNTNDRTQHGFLSGPEDFEVTDKQFKELFDFYRQMIEETSIGLVTLVPPSVTLHFRQVKDGMPGDVESALIVIDGDFNDGDKKREIMRKIGKKAFSMGWMLVAVCMASECWMSTTSKENPNFDILPSQDPNRKEAITICGRTLMGECRMGYLIPVGRDKDDKFIKDGEAATTSEIDTFIIDEVLIGFRDAIKEYLDNK